MKAPMAFCSQAPWAQAKTFLAESFAKDCGKNVVEFKNFPRQVGRRQLSQSRKDSHLLQALAPIVVRLTKPTPHWAIAKVTAIRGQQPRLFKDRRRDEQLR